MSIHAIGALLLISNDPKELAAFYRDALGIPIEEARHDDIPLHYGCEIGGTHFAIHPSADWPGEPAPSAQSPVIVFHTDDVDSAYDQLVAHGVNATPPFDHGFAILTAFRDPEGNNVQVMRLASETDTRRLTPQTGSETIGAPGNGTAGHGQARHLVRPNVGHGVDPVRLRLRGGRRHPLVWVGRSPGAGFDGGPICEPPWVRWRLLTLETRQMESCHTRCRLGGRDQAYFARRSSTAR